MSGYDKRPPYGEGRTDWWEEAKFIAFMVAALGLWGVAIWKSLG